MCVSGRLLSEVWSMGWEVIGMEGVATRKLPQRPRGDVMETRPRPPAAGWKEVARLAEM